MSWIEQFERLLTPERRSGWRKPVRVPVQVVFKDDTSVGCELMEASPTGFRLRSPRKLPKRQMLTLRFPGRRYVGELLDVPAEIVWSRTQGKRSLPCRSGGRFLPMTERLRKRLAERLLITSGLEMAEIIEKRRQTRLMQHATIGQEQLVVRDISLDGVGLLAQKSMPLGERVEVVVDPEDPILCLGRVIWSRSAMGGHAWYVGVRFEEMPRATREQLVERLARMMQRDGLFRY